MFLIFSMNAIEKKLNQCIEVNLPQCNSEYNRENIKAIY